MSALGKVEMSVFPHDNPIQELNRSRSAAPFQFTCMAPPPGTFRSCPTRKDNPEGISGDNAPGRRSSRKSVVIPESFAEASHRSRPQEEMILPDTCRPLAVRGPVTITVRENELPSFVGPQLDRLYGSLYSSLAHFRSLGELDDMSTYVAWQDDVPIAIFLFRRDGDKVRVANEGMELDADEVVRFAQHVFATSAFADVVEFHAVKVDSVRIPLLHQRSFCAEDFIVRLPATAQDYTASLGQSTRKNLRRHRNQLERDFPGFRHDIVERSDVDERDIRHMLELSRQRMERKGLDFAIGEDEARHIVRLVQQSGALLVASIDGRCCGGSVLFRFGKDWTSRVNAHDPAFDDYRLGMICCHLAICSAIEAGAERFHLGHTWYEYKTALLGEFERFDHLALYRSPYALVRHAGTAIKTAYAGYALTANRWLLHHAGADSSPGWRAAGKLLETWRAAKRRRGDHHPG